MKISVNAVDENKFKPIKVEIILDTQNECDGFMNLVNLPESNNTFDVFSLWCELNRDNKFNTDKFNLYAETLRDNLIAYCEKCE